MTTNGSNGNGNGHSDENEPDLTDKWASFVAKKKAATHCQTCQQPLPNGHSPYRDAPISETVEESTPFTVLRSKVQAVWQFLFTNTPAPIKWMFKSVGWILVGSVVAAAFIGASYFLVRYLVWYLLIALGKWLWDRIGRGIPHVVGGAIGEMVNGTPSQIDTNYWMIGALAVCGVYLFYSLGKAVMDWVETKQ